MSVSFPPPVGPSGPTTPPPPSTPPFPEVPLDNFSSSSVERLVNTQPVNAAVPQLPLATYYGTVAQAITKQKAQEIENKLKDAEILINLWRFFQEKALFAKTIINGAFEYQALQASLLLLQLDMKKNELNDAIQAFNSTYAPQDAVRINEINNAITAFNQAENDYQTALANYSEALNDYNSALDTYHFAVSTYEDALESYQNGEITEAELLAAQDTFNAAKDIYDASRNTLDSQKTLLDNSVSALSLAKNNLDAERVTYNNYIINRQVDVLSLNLKISQWNSAILAAQGLLVEMNQIRDILGYSPLEVPETMSLVQNLGNFSYPTGSQTLTLAVQAEVNNTNDAIGEELPPSGVNGEISIANLRIQAIGLSSVTPIPYEDLLNPLLLVTLYGALDLKTAPSLPVEATYTTPPEEDLVTPNVLPQLESLKKSAINIARERRFQDSLEEDIPPVLERRTLLGGAGASAHGVTLSNLNNSLKNPILERQLSRQSFEAFFNFYGVSVGSPLIDQIGAVYENSLRFAELTSAAFASEILGDAAIRGENGQKALNTALALGNLTQMNRFLTSGQLNLTLAFFIDKDPSLTALSPERKTKLIEDLVAYLGNMALKDALKKMGEAVELPGLMPQLLANTVSSDQKDFLISKDQPLLQSILLSEQLSNSFAISLRESDAIAREAISKESQEDQLEYLLSQLADIPLQSGSDRERAILEALQKKEELFQLEKVRLQQAKEDAFKVAAHRAMDLQEIDRTRFLIDANRIELSSEEAARRSLMDIGLSQDDATQITDAGWKAYNSKSNPLESFFMERIAGSTESSALLKAKIEQIFSPVVGDRKAREVAEDYGSLIYTAPNSLLNLLKENERQVIRVGNFKADSRLFDDYRIVTEAYRNPATSPDNPLHLGKTLLLTGLAGGVYFAGATSADNTLGPSGNKNKYATDYHGILG